MAKKTRPPKLFPVAIPETRFHKSILRRVHTAGDREFLLGLYALEADGNRHRKQALDERELQRLRSLAKSVGANRGFVQVPKLIVLAVIVAVVIVFNLLFKNALLTRALVAGLEGVFGARAEVAGLDFRVLGGSIAIDRVSVADRERPLRNLFEIGRTELSIDVFRLFEGSVIVRDLVCRDVRWDTERATSGALAKVAEAEGPAAGAEPSEGILDKAKGLVQGFDIPGLVDREIDALSSPKRIADANARLSVVADTWSARVAKDHADLEALAAEVERIAAFDLSTVKTAKDAQEIVEAIAGAAPAVRSLTNELTAAGRDLAAETKRIQAERAGLQAAIASDAAALGAKLDLSQGGWKNLASTLASQVLERYLGSYATWVIRAKDAAVGLVQRPRSGGKKEKPLGRGGRTVAYPGASRPRFLVENAAFSVAERADLPRIEGSLSDLTTDPDLVGRPIDVSAAVAAGVKALSLDATIDTRTGEPGGTRVALAADNWDLGLNEGLEPLGIDTLAGIASIRTEVSLVAGGAILGTGAVTVRDMVLGTAAGDDPIVKTVVDAIRSVPETLVDFTYAAAAGGAPQITTRTNLDEVLSSKIGEQAQRLTADAKVRLRGELDARLAPELAQYSGLADRLAGLRATAGEDLAGADDLSAALLKVQKDLETRLKTSIPLPKITF